MRGRYIFGLVLIIVGFGIFLEQYDVLMFSDIIGTWWPMIFVIIGLSSISKGRNNLITGLVFIAIGLIFQGNELDYLPGGFWGTFWPLLLIIIGASLLFARTRLHKKDAISDSDIDLFVMFGGREEYINSKNFRKGTITTFFGGMEIDMSHAEMSAGGVNLDITSVFGGVELILPENHQIRVKGMPLFGACENKTNQNIDPNAVSSVININYFVMFGGIEIKNHRKVKG